MTEPKIVICAQGFLVLSPRNRCGSSTKWRRTFSLPRPKVASCGVAFDYTPTSVPQHEFQDRGEDEALHGTLPGTDLAKVGPLTAQAAPVKSIERASRYFPRARVPGESVDDGG